MKQKVDIGLMNQERLQKDNTIKSAKRGHIPLFKFKRMGPSQAFVNDMFFEIVNHTEKSIVFKSKLFEYDMIELEFYKEGECKIMKTRNIENDRFEKVLCDKTPASTIFNAAMKKLKEIKGE